MVVFRYYIELLLFIKKNAESMSGNAIAREKKMFNTTVQSRLQELESFGLVEKVYQSRHINLWNITYNGKAVLELVIIIEEI